MTKEPNTFDYPGTQGFCKIPLVNKDEVVMQMVSSYHYIALTTSLGNMFLIDKDGKVIKVVGEVPEEHS